MNRERAKELLPIIQAFTDGKTVERYNSVTSAWDTVEEEIFPSFIYRIKPLEFPPLPEGLEWHNPEGLTPEQVGEGFRLLVTSEVNIIPELCLGSNTDFVEGWERGQWDNNGGRGLVGCVLDITYRVPISTPFPEPPKKVVMVPWDSTHDFPKLPVIWIRGKDDYREHLVIGYANPVTIITATCGSCPVLESMHLNSDWRHGSIEWSTDRKTWQPCEKPAGS
jgi:hypothetical protein